MAVDLPRKRRYHYIWSLTKAYAAANEHVLGASAGLLAPIISSKNLPLNGISLVPAHPQSEPIAALQAYLPWRRRAVEIGLIFLVFLIFGGEPTPHHNEPHYLCRLKHFWNPNWCQGDLFLDSPDAHLVFVVALGWVTKWLSLPATAWVGRGICWLGLAWAWQRLSWRVVPQPLAAVLSAVLVLSFIRQGHLAGEWLVGGVEAKCVAYIFVLIGLIALVDGQWNKVWMWLGAATAFHALVGGWSGMVCAGIWFLHARREMPFSKMVPGLAVGTLMALPGVVPALQLVASNTPEVVAEANRIYVFERLPHHLAPLTLPVGEIARRVSRHAILIAVLVLVSTTNKRIEFPDTVRSGLGVVSWFAWGAVCLALMGFVIELTLWNAPLTAAKLLKYYWFRLTDITVPIALSIQLAATVVAGVTRQKAWGAAALVGALVFGGWQLMDVCKQRLENPVPPADHKMRDYAAWVDVCEWITSNTPEDALFLTPRSSSTFKWRTGRPEVVTRKDIPQDAASMVEWYRRLREIHYRKLDDEFQPYWSLGHKGIAQIEQLAAEYPFDFVLTDHRRRLGLPVVYRNQTYVLYAIRRD